MANQIDFVRLAGIYASDLSQTERSATLYIWLGCRQRFKDFHHKANGIHDHTWNLHIFKDFKILYDFFRSCRPPNQTL